MRPEPSVQVQGHAKQLLHELSLIPKVWGQYKFRTGYEGSPHRDIEDIWVRYNALSNLDPANPQKFNEPHESVWYPVADKLPSVARICNRLMEKVGARTLGGVLLTRVPAGAQVHWHRDGGWHASAHRKWCVSIAARTEQTFEFEGEQMRTHAGECFEFDNSYPHAVMNPSYEDRVSLIVSLRDFEKEF